MQIVKNDPIDAFDFVTVLGGLNPRLSIIVWLSYPIADYKSILGVESGRPG